MALRRSELLGLRANPSHLLLMLHASSSSSAAAAAAAASALVCSSPLAGLCPVVSYGTPTHDSELRHH